MKQMSVKHNLTDEGLFKIKSAEKYLERTPHHKMLGIDFNETLSWNTHTSTVSYKPVLLPFQH